MDTPARRVPAVTAPADRIEPDATSRARPQDAREAAAEWVPRSALKPWAQNPRRNDTAVPAVVASIQRFGFGAPILARRADGEVIAGHTRLKAAEALGLERVPVRYLDLDPVDAHLLALADNKLSEKADWDNGKVAEVLSGYGLDDAELAGWDQAELDKLGGALGADDEPAPDQTDAAKVGFAVLIECASGEEQLAVIARAQEEGWKCKALD